MPATYNGIGTHYYGKKNLQVRTGTCRSCGRTVQLKSYDTRLWFVIAFIPIFPLGRKRIIDQCPACRRHYVAEAEKWETARQLEVSGAQEKFRNDPSAENAIAVHQQLLQFHQIDQAAEFQKTLVENFSDNAKVQAYLGAALAHFGKHAEAEPFYAKALELRPDMPEARVGVARGLIRAGKLDEARALLDFLEKPGASKLYPLEPLDTLARAYQKAGQNAAALSVFAAVLRELPKVGEEKWFRKLVAKSETKGQPSILPKLKFSWKRLFQRKPAGQPTAKVRLTWRGMMILAIVLGLVGIGMMISNVYISHHRTLYIVSAYETPALVEVTGQGQVHVLRNVAEMQLAEGKYHAKISGPVTQELDFEISGGYWARWFGGQAWVLNVGGSAILDQLNVTYSQSPVPGTHTFLFGETFFSLGGVTHPFRDVPEKADDGTHYERLTVFTQEPSDLFYYLVQKKNIPEALRLAESHLRVQPDDGNMLRLYGQTAQEQKQLARADAFLRAGLTNRPVVLQWHRFYQNMHRDAAGETELAKLYDRELQIDPLNANLMYLRGRVSLDPVEGRQWFHKACEVAPDNPYPFFALAFDQVATGDWAGSRTLLVHVCELQPKQPEFVMAFFQTRLALGEFEALEKELRAQVAAENLNYMAAQELCEVLVAEGKPAEAADVIQKFEAAASDRSLDYAQGMNPELTHQMLYATKDFATLKANAARDRTSEGSYAEFVALIELGELEAATKLFPIDSVVMNNPYHYLNTAIAYHVAGDAQESSRWLARGIALLSQGSVEMTHEAAALQKTDAPTSAELDAIALAPEMKATLMAVLAQLHPDHRAEYAAMARKFNVSYSFPHYLIERAVAE